MGSVTRLTKKEIQRICDAHGITPLEYLLDVINNPNMDVKYKLDAAGKAMPYVHARLAPQVVDEPVQTSHERILDQLG